MFDDNQDIQKIEGKLTFGSKNDMRIWQIFTRGLERPKIGTLMAFFCPNLKMHELKTYRGVICHDNKE